MANITIKVPDNSISDLVDAFAEEYGYQSTVTNEAGEQVQNLQTKAQFAREQVLNFIRNVYQSNRIKKATDNASKTEADEVKIITDEFTL
jgi:hypothetical protein